MLIQTWHNLWLFIELMRNGNTHTHRQTQNNLNCYSLLFVLFVAIATLCEMRTYDDSRWERARLWPKSEIYVSSGRRWRRRKISLSLGISTLNLSWFLCATVLMYLNSLDSCGALAVSFIRILFCWQIVTLNWVTNVYMTHGHNTFEEKQQNVALGAGVRTLTQTHSHLSISRELRECVRVGIWMTHRMQSLLIILKINMFTLT